MVFKCISSVLKAKEEVNPFTGAGDFFRHGVVELFKNS